MTICSTIYDKPISYLMKAVARGERAELAGTRATSRHVELLDAATFPTLESVTMGMKGVVAIAKVSSIISGSNLSR